MSKSPLVKSVAILGAGSAGLMTALAIKKRCPRIKLTIVASSKRGVIGVGEGSTPNLPAFIHNYLGLDEAATYRSLDPVYKLGVRFTWGKRPFYDYTFDMQPLVTRGKGMSRSGAWFVGDDHEAWDFIGALMQQEKALPARQDGLPDLPAPGNNYAWHLENERFVNWLAETCKQREIHFVDAEVSGADRSPEGPLTALVLDSGERVHADFFIDSSGFQAQLIGGVLDEPFVDFSKALHCDTALVGGWDRGEETTLPFTCADSMENGWCWRIDHPERINRGYVHSSAHIDAESAEREMRSANPKLGELRLIKFTSGRRSRQWVENVIAVGNAAGFVEPLEATALMCAALQAQWCADGLFDSEQRPNPSLRDLYNKLSANLWDEIRDFLALHYRYNDRLDTPFWEEARNETPLGEMEAFAAFFEENGPSPLLSSFVPSTSPFELPGYLAHFLGMKAPHQRSFKADSNERMVWNRSRRNWKNIAGNGLRMEQVRSLLSEPINWQRLRQPAQAAFGAPANLTL